MNKLIIITLSLLTISVTSQAMPLPSKKPSTITEPIKVTESKKEKPPIKKNRKTTILPMANHAKPLNNQSIALYKEIFTLQEKQKWVQADILIKKINNNVLIGHVFADRFLDKNYDAEKHALESWITTYPDHPQSKAIDSILKTKHSKFKNRINGTLDDLRYFSNGSKYLSKSYKNGQRYELRLVKKEVKKSLDRGAVTAALNFFNNHRIQKYIDPIDKSQILAEIASHYLYLNRPKLAQTIALKALKASKKAPLAGWTAGLIAWMDGDMAEAARYFTIASNAPYASPWMTSAASYWGARASTRAGLYKDVTPLLAKAVKNQRTFYGIIATKAMGYGYDLNWTMPAFGEHEKDILMQYPSGARAIALSKIDQMEMSESELFNLPVKENKHLANAVIAFANHYNLAGYAMRFSSAKENPAGGYYDAGLFPISSWTRNIKNSDPALINAFIRQESRFIANARNKTGATGIMQIMPQTAAFITGNGAYKGKHGQALLNNPKTNIQIGADYLRHLLKLKAVDNDLFGLAVAYNAGPGKYARWKKNINTDDPLLFIELIPASETRAFVERVATNYWIYSMQMGIEPKTLLSVASGKWPKMD